MKYAELCCKTNFSFLEGASHAEELATRAAEAGYLLEDLAAELAGYGQDLEADPARLEEIHRRRAELAGLARAHGSTVDEVIDWASQAGLRLARIDTAEGAEELEATITRLDTTLATLGARLSAGRAEAAARLAAVVSEELSGLAMPDAHPEARLDPTDEPGPWGAEDVAMLLAPHAGATASDVPRPDECAPVAFGRPAAF